MDMSFAELQNAISRLAPRDMGARLKIATRPNPFVPPTLSTDKNNAMSAEALFVQASAAVGKSTLAAMLSATCGIPLLDLAAVPVSTGSLKALVLEVAGENNALDTFHAGRLPIIVDALDEGRLLSQENGFTAFMETAGELLKENRSVTDRPKLIFFGRYESVELARLAMEIGGDGLVTSTLEVSYFDEKSAWELINAYAELNSDATAAFRQHKDGSVKDLIASYFIAIEAALGLSTGQLWESAQGRAFAGYAPVLAALGSLIARMDNFVEVCNRLRDTGTHEAWGVIETVLKTITEREQTKLRDKLDPTLAARVPAQAYDTEEQLTLIAQYIQGRALAGSGRVRLSGGDQAQYETKVGIILPDHPFVRQREFANAVLASAVMAHALLRGQVSSSGIPRLADLSRQPFLWRSLASKLNADVLLEGDLVGYALTSLWNDPLRNEGTIRIHSTDDPELITMLVPNTSDNWITSNCTFPLGFFGQLRDTEVDVAGTVRLLGQGAAGAGSSFQNRGRNVLICENLEAEADSIRFDGECWYEATTITTPQNFAISPTKGTKLGWGGELSRTFPWNRYPGTLDAPYSIPEVNVFDALVRECWIRIPDGGNLTLNPDLTPAPNDPHLRWVARKFVSEFPKFIQLAIDNDLAVSETMQARGTPKVRIRFNISWNEIVNALRSDEPSNPKYKSFIDEGRAGL